MFFTFQGLEHIGEKTRRIVILVLSAIAAIGIVVLILLPPIKRDESDEDTIEEVHMGPIETLKGSAKLFVTKRMLLLCITFFYTGNRNYLQTYKNSIGDMVIFFQVLN